MTIALSVAISSGRSAAVANIRHFWHIWQRLQSHFDQGNQACDLSRSGRRRGAGGVHF